MGCAIVLALLPWMVSGARAQNGGVFFIAADSTGTSRAFPDHSPGVCTVYIVQNAFYPGAGFTGVRFKVDNNAFTGMWLMDQTAYTALGISQSGIAISYGGCVQPPILVLTVRYYCYGNSPCTTVGLEADPLSESGWIEVLDCNYELLSVPAIYELCVNGAYVPDDTGFGHCDCTIPAQDTTWGQIKHLYTD